MQSAVLATVKPSVRPSITHNEPTWSCSYLCSEWLSCHC